MCSQSVTPPCSTEGGRIRRSMRLPAAPAAASARPSLSAPREARSAQVASRMMPAPAAALRTGSYLAARPNAAPWLVTSCSRSRPPGAVIVCPPRSADRAHTLLAASAATARTATAPVQRTGLDAGRRGPSAREPGSACLVPLPHAMVASLPLGSDPDTSSCPLSRSLWAACSSHRSAPSQDRPRNAHVGEDRILPHLPALPAPAAHRTGRGHAEAAYPPRGDHGAGTVCAVLATCVRRPRMR
jgi:hypothetical protein